MDIKEENDQIQEAFEIEADEMGFCLDQKWGEYENPYENSDTALAFNLFKKGWSAKASAVPEWVSVDERLPDGYVQMLAINNKGVIRVAEHAFYEDEWRKAPSLKTAKHPVTHWMPLPEAHKAQELSND